MPTYEYQCEKCGHVFDVFQSIKASPLKKADCDDCGGKQPVKRLIGTGAGVIFKGSGFYQTDYRSEGYKKAAESEKGDGKKTESKSDAKAEKSKPAEKSKSASKESSAD